VGTAAGRRAPVYLRQRLTVARGFARHLATIDPTSEVPPVDLLPGHRPRIAPYVYSGAEIMALMAAARQLRPALRAARHETLIGLLAVTGCRPGEALGLDRADVDLANGVVHVRVGKKNKQREVPLRQSTVGALRGYTGLRDARFPTPSSPAFFLSARGRRMGREELNETFIKLVRQVGLEGAGSRARPRPHDLRHAFAVHTLLDWYRTGENIAGGCRCCRRISGTSIQPAPTGTSKLSPNCCSWSASAWSGCPGCHRERARARAAGVFHRPADHPA